MRRLIVLAFLAAGLVACGSSSNGKPTQLEYGTTGGNLIPFKVVIAADGRVHWGAAYGQEGHGGPPQVLRISDSRLRSLESQVRVAVGAGLGSRRCTGTLPDVASRYVRLDGDTVTVHGTCERSFERLWSKLIAVVPVRYG